MTRRSRASARLGSLGSQLVLAAGGLLASCSSGGVSGGMAPSSDSSGGAAGSGEATAGGALGQVAGNLGSRAAGGGAIGGGGAGALGSAGDAGSGGTSAGANVAGVASEAGEAGAPSGLGLGCAPGRYLLCEDFESTALGGTPDGWTKHGDASGVADDAAKHGTHSLKLGAIAVWERRIDHDASALGSAHWGRIFYKVQLPVPDAFVHSTLVAFSGTGPTIGAAEYRVVDTVKQAIDTPDLGSRHQFLYNVQPENGDEFGTGTSYDWSFDGKWHCAEWHIDSADQSYHFYLDGAEEIAFTNGAGNYDGSEIPTQFGEIKIGWINYQSSPPGFTAWLDDLALDRQRIGCD